MKPGRWFVALAGCTGLGALVPRATPVLIVAALVGVAPVVRRPWLWCLVALVLASLLSARSWAGLDPPARGELSGAAVVVADPEERYGAVRAELRVAGRRYDAWARGSAAGRLRSALAGEVLRVSGSVSPLRGRASAYLRRRHLVARLEVQTAGPVGPGSPLSRIANATRRTIDRGTEGLDDSTRALFGGFVLGDDRGQDDATVERFRAAGLTHLLVVSGQNVAFVLALAAPLVRRGSNGWRLACTVVLLILFGSIVRWDPSVLRAVVMAALAVSARTLGGAVDRLQVLAIAVTIILLIDPLLIGSVSFLLSVGASVGICLLSPWFATRIRGPRPIVEVLSATAGAQVGVAPVLIPVFGSLPLASVPANLLAVPMAGPLMMWGMVAGLPAGLAGDPVARLLHWPTQLMVSWIDGVARFGAAFPAPPVGAAAGLAALASVALFAVHPRSRPFLVPGAASVLVVVALIAAPRPPRGFTGFSDARLWTAGGATVLVVDQINHRLPEELRAAGVGRADVLVMTSGGVRAAELLVRLRAELSPGHVFAPDGSGIPDAVPIRRASSVRVGPIDLQFDLVKGRVAVRVSVSSNRDGMPAPRPPIAGPPEPARPDGTRSL